MRCGLRDGDLFLVEERKRLRVVFAVSTRLIEQKFFQQVDVPYLQFNLHLYLQVLASDSRKKLAKNYKLQ
jgi:hypothetical protein